jgi:hypothetical protein
LLKHGLSSFSSSVTQSCGRLARRDVALGDLAGEALADRRATEASEISPVSAAKPPSSAALGSGRPRCSSASSVAGTVSSRSRAEAARRTRRDPSSSKLRLVLISM